MVGKLRIPVGIPGCGKSTWAEKSGYKVVSSDAIRAKLGDVNDQSKNSEVFAQFDYLIRHYLLIGMDVVADATNLRDFARARLVKIADDLGAEKHLIIFANPLEAFQRNRARERTVPEDVMYRMVDQYERALLDIGIEQVKGTYTTVTKIRSYK